MSETETLANMPTPTPTIITHAAPTNPDVDMDEDSTNCLDDDMEATQRFEDEPVDTKDTPLPTPTPTQTEVVSETPTPTDESFDVAGASVSAAPFAAAFGTVWRLMLSLGWQTAQGPGTEFVSMPGTQFFNFRPNINVFDSKGKACWKWLALAAERERVNAAEAPVWETLWTIAETQFGWYTMSSGNETWFVKPNTAFTAFQPNVTIFQTKKRAVLQALAVSNVKIELGDSVDGKQVLDFAAKPEESKPKAAKKEKASDTPSKSKSKENSDTFTTPPPKTTTALSSKKTKATPTTSSAKKTGKKSVTAPATKKNAKSPKTPKSAAKREETQTKPETPLQFHVPEFKCTFAHVYKQLQERGWHHKPGSFEYDYFSPDYTKETQILNGNYFQSAAEFEGFLKDSGMWADIEAEMRDEHAALVEELREEAEEKRRKQRIRNAKQAAAKAKANADADSTATPVMEPTKSVRSPLKKKKSAFRASMEASMAAVAAAAPSPGTKRDAGGGVKISMGKVVEKLVKRGWYYRPGRFEYDYFKPNVTSKKNAIPGEDFFQSLSELEEYLKTADLWEDIAQEIRNDADEDEEDDHEVSDTPAPKKQRLSIETKKSPIATTPREADKKRTAEEETGAEPLEPAAAALSNDIWGNSHQIDFEKY